MISKSLCFAFSDDYSANTAATISSFLIHNPGSWTFYFISDYFSANNKNKLTRLISNYSTNNNVHFISVDKSLVEKYPIGEISKHVSYHAMFRLLIPNLLPENVDFALYLDSDLIIQSNITELFSMDLDSSQALGAIIDYKYVNRREKYGIKRYFNSGVLLLNLKYWREHDCTRKLLLQDVPSWVKLVDQDILNLFFNTRWKEVNILFNVPASLLYDRKRAKEAGLSKNEARIVHFLGGLKPWDYWLPYSALYWKYLIKTPYWPIVFKIPETLLNSLFYKFKKLGR